MTVPENFSLDLPAAVMGRSRGTKALCSQTRGTDKGAEAERSRTNVLLGVPLGWPLPSNLILHAVIEKLFL